MSGASDLPVPQDRRMPAGLPRRKNSNHVVAIFVTNGYPSAAGTKTVTIGSTTRSRLFTLL